MISGEVPFRLDVAFIVVDFVAFALLCRLGGVNIHHVDTVVYFAPRLYMFLSVR